MYNGRVQGKRHRFTEQHKGSIVPTPQWSHNGIVNNHSLTVVNQHEADIRAIPNRVLEIDTSSRALPFTQLHQPAHGGRASVRCQYGVGRLCGWSLGEDVGRDHFSFVWRMVIRGERAAVYWVGRPDICLGVAGSDLAVAQGRKFDFESTASGAGGNVVEGQHGDLVIDQGRTAALEGKLLARVGGVGICGVENIDDSGG